mmetsp:Transcript_53140/g.99618  ORF Transcript_53140/g.99618 Transcript_53140/m.99618 type:complete len:407 (-) Transcript_53140:111-1331(-)
MRLPACFLLISSVSAARVLLAGEGIGARRHALSAGSLAALREGRDQRKGPRAGHSRLPEVPLPWRSWLQVVQKLAGGGYGTVYKARITCGNSGNSSTQFVAMKVMQLSGAAAREVKALRKMHGVTDYCASSLGNPDHVDFQGRRHVLMPFMNQGDFYDLVSRCLSKPSCNCHRPPGMPLCWEAMGAPYSEPFVLALMLQVMRGVQALLRHHLVHMDLKLENAMLHCEGVSCYAQVVDLGLSCPLHSDDCPSVGTPGYMAPEVWLQHGVGTSQNDVFSLGVMLYIFALGKMPPFGGDVDGSQTAAYRPREDPWLQLEHLQPLGDLIMRMLNPHPSHRLKLKEAIPRLHAIILNKSHTEDVRRMIEMSPEQAGAHGHMPECVYDHSGSRPWVPLPAALISALCTWVAF